MFIDFDGFKRVNDSFGHDAGDELLKEAARRFSACVRKTDTVARIGGDEFLIVVTEMKIPENASKVAEKLIESFSKPFRINSSHQILMTVSIGISFYPRDSDNLEGLIKLADEAMYEVKKNGKNGYVFSKTVLDQKSG